MFSSKKDEEISRLKDEIIALQARVKSEESLRIETIKSAEKEHTDFLIFKEQMQLREEEFNTEIASLKRIIASEKKKRINSSCANRRRNLGRKKLN
jgi:hypothetical protein